MVNLSTEVREELRIAVGTKVVQYVLGKISKDELNGALSVAELLIGERDANSLISFECQSKVNKRWNFSGWFSFLKYNLEFWDFKVKGNYLIATNKNNTDVSERYDIEFIIEYI